MKSIAFYVKTTPLIKGGIERLVACISNYLCNQYMVYIIADSNKGEPYPFVLDEKIKLINIPFRRDNKFIAELKAFIDTKKIELVVIMRTGGDIVQVFSAATYETNCKIVFSEHCAPNIAENEYKNKTRDLVAHCADFIHLLATEYITSIPTYLRSRVFSIPNYYDFENTNIPTITERKNRIVMVGRLTRTQKRPLLLLEAFNKLPKQYQDQWELHFFGEGPEKTHLENYVNNFKINNVFFRGQIEDVKQELIKAKLFCLPSAYEGLSIALIEALACGLPCIVFKNSPGNNIVIKNNYNGLLSSEDNLAETILYAISDEELLIKLSKGAYESSQKYSKERIMNNWGKFIKFCLQQNKISNCHLYQKKYFTDIVTKYYMEM